jgi:hypothetical protein
VKRICVIGNSHCACLKLAWDALSTRYPAIQLTFFAQRGVGMADLTPQGKVLVPANEQLKKAMIYTSGGLGVIDLHAYDAVMTVGYTWGYPPGQGHFSFAAVSRAMLDFTPRTLAVGMIAKIRAVSDIPIFVAHQPLRRHDGDENADADLGPYRRLVGLLNAELMLPHGAALLAQPPQTIANFFYTRAEFSVGARRLDNGDGDFSEEQRADPRSHMNARYGDIFLSTHLPTVASGQLPN